MKKITIQMLLSIVLGILFVLSGFVKAVDPMGLSYKIEEYIGMFQFWEWSTLSTPFAILLCVAEMTFGLLLLLQLWRRTTAVVITIFILVFTIVTYIMYIDPNGGISDCGCFGDAIHLSNEVTFVKNVILLMITIWYMRSVLRKPEDRFDYRQLWIGLGVVVVSLSLPLYSYFYLPPFDFLPYNVGDTIDKNNHIGLYNSDLKDITKELFETGKPTYMIGLKGNITNSESNKIATLYQAYENGEINLFVASPENNTIIPIYPNIPTYIVDGVVLKSVLRSPVGVIAFDGNVIAGKWNLRYTPYGFNQGFENKIIKKWGFLSVLLISTMLLFYLKMRYKYKTGKEVIETILE